MQPGDILSHREMCSIEDMSLQRGMNYRAKGSRSIVLMSQRKGAPYEDAVLEDGRVLIYEGHDQPKSTDNPDPKRLDQIESLPNGRLNQNGLFFNAVRLFKSGKAPPERVRVYEKIKVGIWTYNGEFNLVDAWAEQSGLRKVFKFKLVLAPMDNDVVISASGDTEPTRVIPPHIKLAVWKRDNGRCVQCGRQDDLHFDHVIPFSKGGSSFTADNIQLLCASHNLEKRDRIL